MKREKVMVLLSPNKNSINNVYNIYISYIYIMNDEEKEELK